MEKIKLWQRLYIFLSLLEPIENLENIISQLETALALALSPIARETEGKSKGDIERVPLASDISKNTERIEICTTTIRSLVDRLEI